jgi:hypothetical protein
MHKKEREITDPARMKSILKKGKYAVIALCRDGRPYIVTLSCGYDEARFALYFHTALVGLKLDIIKANPAACATVIIDRGYLAGECSHGYRSVVMNGTMHVVESLEEKKHGMDVLLVQLEEDPDAVRRKSLMDVKAYDRTCILRLDIDDMSGKSGH